MKNSFPLFVLFAMIAFRSRKADAQIGTYIAPSKAAQYLPFFEAAELKYNLPKGILSRIADQESDFNPTVTGKALEQGLMQIHPKWHTPTTGNSFYDPEYSIFYAAEYLRSLKNTLEKWGWSNTWRTTLLAYNWGIGNVQKFKNGEITNVPDSAMSYATAIADDIGL